MWGAWVQVCLQNCHLAASWMPELATIARKVLSQPDLHDSFRLWIASESFDAFPVSLLSQSLKATLEPPRSIKATVASALSIIPDDLAVAFERGSEQWRRLMFSTVLFHGIVQDRRKFGALGWNIPHEFAPEDLLCSLRSMQGLLAATAVDDKPGTVPLEAIRRIAGEINYGGRVTDDVDRAVIAQVLDRLLRGSSEGGTQELGGAMALPENCVKMHELVEHVGTLDSLDKPEMFGLHASAQLVLQAQVRSRFM